jgi:hypothetical protein
MNIKARLNKSLGKTYLIYLGLLPSIATLAILWEYGHRFPFLVFIGGVGAIGVYLAATFAYTRFPTQLLPLLFLVFDGPLFVLISLRNNFQPLAFAIEGYLIDGIDIWLSILILALTAPLPTRNQRIAAVFFMVAAIGITTSLFWPYIQSELWGQPRALWLFLVW